MSRKTITMTLYVSELVYDIQNKTYLTGRSRQTGTNHEEVANMQANDDDENANQILRSIQNAFGILKTKLSEWIDESGTTATNKLMSTGSSSTVYYKASVSSGTPTWTPTTSITDVEKSKSTVSVLPTTGVSDGDVYALTSLGGNNTLNLSLVMPSNYNNSTRETINAALHQYIVNTAIGDWFTITDKADASDYYTLAGNNLETIREAANKRVRPTRQSV